MDTLEAPRKLTRREKIEQGIPKDPGSKKSRRANERKAAKKERITAKLRNQRGSQRKFRLVIELVKGKSVPDALAVLKLDTHAVSEPLRKLILSAIANFNDRFPDSPYTEEELYIKHLTADSSFVLKRIQPRAQGRAFRIRKRYSTISVELAPFAELAEEESDDDDQ